ncbi:hypothetical protein ACFX13_022104 [Malus domestica]|uniref:UPF0481 protein At3g47200-like n=1 Tax=Malus domestica TaxID=3750 RepID=UPI0010AA7B30|nr:UPF0481 protein At3g47200-like [Malus domestica]XP_017179111.2 UPF0481 protein At3g47200-like [Malus domestica]XP_017179112.2 UPF0481 protein At3g47200-like [Malus domestica]XP_028952508.1 UPF0481 protein At3g47200-like [Malus domestica]
MENSYRSEKQAQASDHVTPEIIPEPQTGDHVALEIIPEHDVLVSSIKEKMENVAVSVCIFQVPDKLLDGNKKKYTPENVSIGPLHRREPTKVGEDDKWRYSYALLNRKPNLEASLSICVKALRELEHKARRCYEGEIDLPSDEFVQLLLVDGCFIIELFLKYAYKSLRSRRDPIFSTVGMLFGMRNDLALLLENQIPFFVVQRLFQLVPLPKKCNESLSELAARFCKRIIPGDDEHVIQDKFNREGYHLLDLIRHSILPTYPKLPPKEDAPPKNIDCAKILKRAGIKFKSARSPSFLDIKFSHGVFKIPSLEVHGYTETLLRNLVALEQRQIDDTVQHVTSYAFLMGCLISSEKDVKFLRRREILTHDEKKDNEVFEVFKNLCKEISLKDFYYVRIFEEVGEYKRKSWHEKRQKLKHKHLKTSTSVVVFVVAILLLLLTFVGACFSILTFALHHV